MRHELEQAFPVNPKAMVLTGAFLLYLGVISPTLAHFYNIYFNRPGDGLGLPLLLSGIALLILKTRGLEGKVNSIGGVGVLSLTAAIGFYQLSLATDIRMASTFAALILFAVLFTLFFSWAGLKKAGWALGIILMSFPLASHLDFWLGFQLRLLSSNVVFFLLFMMNEAQSLNGVHMILQNGALTLDESCSGLRALGVLLFLTITLGHLNFPGDPLKKTGLILFGAILAVLENFIRIVGVAVLANRFGADFAQGMVHSFLGMFTFSLALLILWKAHEVLRK